MSGSERTFVFTNYTLLTVLTLLIVLPFWYVLIVSITPYNEYIAKNSFVLFPDRFSISYYEYLLHEGSTIYRAYGNTIRNAASGVALALFLTSTCAYALAEKRLPGRRGIILFFVLTLFFKGGMLPLYITVKQLGLLDTKVVLILVMAFSTFLLVIMKTFFEALPESLRESAEIDGASAFRIFWQIVIPLSAPALASIGLIYLVTYWNDFFNALLYISDWNKAPVQLVLRTIVANSSLPPELLETVGTTPPPTIGIQMAGIVIVALPMLVVYPFVQRYFQQGMLIGSVKG